ncbi:CocE/NonD family hydrolase [Actinomadura xylanilytica]|uniref:CocE/NonD family hydrolase n=1 Tax=Actinomadura xylanilytica TaxID=887459 RepID=UPI00255AB1E2|nr:CocE/NonD family hydrolase [Actinomadura xylanilytica]MDL4774568.1 CocE/NonD family hydrolase [Actinomadura xylanilytica]
MMRRWGATALGLRNGPHRVTVERDLEVPASDGVVLLADRHAPVDVERPPTVLVRSPYGRRGPFGLMCGQTFASHGFQAVVQSVRGGFGSGGVFEPLDEHEDGLATIAWLKEQPWFGGTFAMHGPSYLGYVQWAVAAEAGPALKALSMQVTASQFREAINVGGTFALESTLIWVDLTARMKNPLSGITTGIMSPRRARRAALSGRPLGELDRLATGEQQRFFQDLLVSGPDTPFWDKRDFSPTVARVRAPVNMTGGWYDIFLPWQLKDYAALRAAGHRPYLTIGPWFHADQRMMRDSVGEAVTWFRAHLLDDPSDLREQPVRLLITGADEWREFPDWPVPGMREQRWHLQPGGALAPGEPPASEPDAYRYDPTHPTPFLGGPTLLGENHPVADQRRLERRQDVLTYTSAELDDDMEIIGPVAAELFVRSDRSHTDFVVRLCEVTPGGESYNLCEGMRRLLPGAPEPDADGVRRVAVELWPAGHRFKRGNRVRVQVASGAYPRVARNTGTGEPIGTATEMRIAAQEIFHEPGRASAIVLPIVPAPEPDEPDEPNGPGEANGPDEPNGPGEAG